MPALQSFHVQRFKGIENAFLPLASLNVLIGANNSGKSTLIQALHFTISVLQSINVINQWPKRDDGELSTTLSTTQLIYSPTEDIYSLGYGARLQEPKENAISVTLVLEDGRECRIEVRRGRNRNIAVNVSNVGVGKALSDLASPFSIFSPGLAGVTKTEQYVSDGVLLRTIARGDANIVLRNILLRLWQTTTAWEAFLDDIREIFPGLEFDVRFDPSIDETILISLKKQDFWIPIESAGTGILQATQILSYAHRYNPSMLILDEPDSHLHPNNQRLLCSLLESISADRNVQTLLTTHSRHVVDALSQTADYLWVRQGSVDLAGPDDEIGILLDIGALDIRERIQQQDSDIVVLTEDARPKGLRNLLIASGFDLERTALLPYHGCTELGNLRPLMRLVQQNNPNRTVLLHRDRDYLTDQEALEWMERVRELRAVPFLTDGVDIESHFINPSHLAELNENLTQLDATMLINAAQEAVREKSIEKYVNGRVDVLRKTGSLGRLNHGSLAVEATENVRSRPDRYFHGKTLLSELRKIYRNQYNSELRIDLPSTHVCTGSLRDVAMRSFGSRD
jgi:energy-coupling factor transporter ATP-binding protein EcfA2